MTRTPPNHVGWCAILQISLRLRFCFLGTSRFALRCDTDDVAFAHAASTASREVSTLAATQMT